MSSAPEACPRSTIQTTFELPHYFRTGADASHVPPDVIAELAPTGILRAGINLANFLLVSGKSAAGEPEGVAPDLAREIAQRLGVPVAYVPFARPGELADAAGTGVWDIGLIAAEPARAETDRVQPRVRRDRGDLPGARGLAAQLDRGGRPAGRAHRDRGPERLRPLAHAATCVTPSWCARPASMPPSSSSSPTSWTRSPASGRACCRTSRSCPGARILDGSFTAVQQAVGTAKANQAGAAFPPRLRRGRQGLGPGRTPDRAPPGARPLGGTAGAEPPDRAERAERSALTDTLGAGTGPCGQDDAPVADQDILGDGETDNTPGLSALRDKIAEALSCCA